MKQVTIAPDPTQQRLNEADNNPLLKQLVNATPAEIAAYMSANVTTLAKAQTVLTALALAVRYLYLHNSGR